MASLTKRDLVVRISEETGITQARVLEIIQRILDHLVKSLANGQSVELRNFGVFSVRLRKARVGRNPHQPKRDIAIPPRAVVKFRSGKELKALVTKTYLANSPNGPLS